MEFFRFCPGCGRRFHVKLVSKKLVHLKRTPVSTKRVIRTGGTRGRGAGIGTFVVQEGRPLIIDIEEFQYNYKCKHCGHEWSDKHTEEHKEG